MRPVPFLRFKAPPPQSVVATIPPWGLCMGASGVPCTTTSAGSGTHVIYVDDCVLLQHEDDESSSDSGASSSHWWSSDPSADRFWHNHVFLATAWVAHALRNGVSLVTMPLGYATLEDLAALLPATCLGTTIQEKRRGLLDAALICPEILQADGSGRHLSLRAIHGHCDVITATLDIGSLPVMVTTRAPRLLAYRCTSSQRSRIWKSGWCTESDSEDGRYVWFQSLEPLATWNQEVPTVLFFLCEEATHAGMTVFSVAGGSFYTRGENGRIPPQFAAVPPYRSPHFS